jgi:hypothetical protein
MNLIIAHCIRDGYFEKEVPFCSSAPKYKPLKKKLLLRCGYFEKCIRR